MSNLGDCIKVACDFVTFSSVKTCFELRKQFRAEMREDVLQLPNMLWHSWLVVSEGLKSQPQMDVIEPATELMV